MRILYMLTLTKYGIPKSVSDNRIPVVNKVHKKPPAEKSKTILCPEHLRMQGCIRLKSSKDGTEIIAT